MRPYSGGMAILLGFGIAVLAGGCAASPPAPVTARVPASPAARSASVAFDMPGGDLKVTGAGVEFVSGTLAFRREDARPTVVGGSRPSTAGVVQTAVLSQPSGPDTGADPAASWTAQLGGGLPTDITVAKSSGTADLDVSLVDVKDMSVTEASGRLVVKLGGPHPSLSHLTLMNASGATTVDASGEYPALEQLEVRSASGAVGLDISGTWGKSFTGAVATGSGAVNLVLPAAVNVRVNVSTEGGRVSAQGLTREGGAWKHQPSSASPYTLTLNVISVSGDVNLSIKK